jgi:hypothetical protein
MAGPLDDYIKRGRKIVGQHGWMVQGVLPDVQQASYSYTVGLSKAYSHPEIFLVGFDPELARQLLNIAGRRVKGGARLDRPLYLDGVIDAFPVAFRPLTHASVVAHSSAGRAILGFGFDGVQLYLPDSGGLFPWDVGCDLTYARIQTSLLKTVGDPPPRQ